jgi:hypothetical protein
MTPIRVEIDRLVLTDWPLGRQEAGLLRAAVEAELSRLFGSAPAEADWSGGATDRVSGGTVAWPAGGGPAALGARVAQAVYGSVGQ